MLLHRFSRSFLSTSASSSLNPKFQAIASCLLHRPPITMRSLNSFETEYEKYRLMLEKETSRGLFQIRMPGSSSAEDNEEQQVNSIGRHMSGEEGAEDGRSAPVVVGLKKEYMDLPVNDLRRELDRKLYLLVKEKTTGKWSLPSKALLDTSTDPSDVCKEGLMDCFNVADADIYWTGRSPMTVIETPLEGRLKAPFARRNFVFRAQLIGGLFGRPSAERVEAFIWATKEEVQQVLEPRIYSALDPILSM